jgi:hypothetical protein
MSEHYGVCSAFGSVKDPVSVVTVFVSSHYQDIDLALAGKRASRSVGSKRHRVDGVVEYSGGAVEVSECTDTSDASEYQEEHRYSKDWN